MGADIVGKILAGRYEVLWKLGEGGLSSVYAAAHTVTGRKVAIKILQDVPLDGGVTARDMILREAKLLGELQHPNVCAVLDADVSDGVPFMVLEYLTGRTLGKELAQTGPFNLERAVDVVLQVAAGLDAAHRAGIVHRDVKPENIVLEAGVAKLLDFGIAKRQSAQHSYVSVEAKAGTPAYMAPEQHLDPAAVDRRADVYGLGKVLWELLTGERPPQSNSQSSIKRLLRKTMKIRLVKVLPDSPPELDRFLQRALDPNPAERHDSMRTFARELRQAVGLSDTALPLPKPRRSVLPWLGALGSVVIAGLTAAWWPTDSAQPTPPPRARLIVRGAPTQTVRFRGTSHQLPLAATFDTSTIAEALIVETPGKPAHKIWLTFDGDREIDAQSHAP